MKIGIVSDIHCNARALEEALRLMGDVDEVFCPGDILLEYRFSNDVVAILKDRGTHVVLGNHDLGYLSRLADTQGQKKIVDGELLAWLRAQPQELDIQIAGKRLLMVHATPWSWDYVYPGSGEMARYAEVEADYVLGGHTHAIFSGRIGQVHVINPGSAGQAVFTPDGPKLSCAVLEVETGDVEHFQYSDVILP